MWVSLHVVAAGAIAERYVVQPGDTMYSLAKRFGVPVASLQATNPNGLRVGQVLAVASGNTKQPGTPVSTASSKTTPAIIKKSTQPTPANATNGKTTPVATTKTTAVAQRPAPAAPVSTTSSKTSSKTTLAVVTKTATPNAAAASSHVVAAKDTLFSIAKRYNVSLAALRQANGLNEQSGGLVVGQTLKIPTPDVTVVKNNLKNPSQSAGQPTAPATNVSSSAINKAASGSFTVATQANAQAKPVATPTAPTAATPPAGNAAQPQTKPQTKPQIKPQPVSNPAPITPTASTAPTPVTSTAQPQVSAQPVAQPQVSAQPVAQPVAQTAPNPTPTTSAVVANPEKPQTTTKPVAQTAPNPAPTASKPPTSASDANGGGGQRHSVIAGDMLISIARRYGVTVEVLRQTNALSSDMLRVGQVLVIPSPETTSRSPVSPAPSATLPVVSSAVALVPPTLVVPEPTPMLLSDISNKLSIKTAPLPMLDISQSLATTATNDKNSRQHIVVAGDTLSELAQAYGTTVDALRQANNLSTDRLLLGQILQLPGNSAAVASNPDVVGQPTGSTSRNLRSVAESYLGIPYRYGGTTRNGLDCSAFVQLVLGELGVRMPRTSREQYGVGAEVSMNELQYGDLVFFDTLGRGVSHVGIYLGAGQFIHAATIPPKVTITSLSDGYWGPRYLGAKRVSGNLP
jgi:peptidoglycan DL-endopeptidase LytE